MESIRRLTMGTFDNDGFNPNLVDPSIVIPPFYTPDRNSIPITTSQVIKPIDLTGPRVRSSHMSNNVRHNVAGPFTVTGGSLLPAGEYNIVKDYVYTPSPVYSAINIATQEQFLLFLDSDLSSIYNRFDKINIYENKLWIFGRRSSDNLEYVDAYEGINLTDNTVSYSSLDMKTFILSSGLSLGSYDSLNITSISDVGESRYKTLSSNNYGIPMLFRVTTYFGSDKVCIILLNSTGIRVLETFTLTNNNYYYSVLSGANSNTNSLWLIEYKSSDTTFKFIKYTIGSSTFSKKISSAYATTPSGYSSSSLNQNYSVQNDNLVVSTDNLTNNNIITCTDNGTSLNITQQTKTAFGITSSFQVFAYHIGYSTTNRWLFYKENTGELIYLDDSSSALPDSVGTLQPYYLDTASLGNLYDGSRLYGYSGTATGLGAGTWDILFSV